MNFNSGHEYLCPEDSVLLKIGANIWIGIESGVDCDIIILRSDRVALIPLPSWSPRICQRVRMSV